MMKRLIILPLLLLATIAISQHTRSITTVLDSYTITNDVDDDHISSITLTLLQKEMPDTTYRVATITIATADNTITGTQRGAGVSSNITVAFGGSTTTELSTSRQAVALKPTTIAQVVDFYNWALTQTRPLPEHQKNIQLEINNTLQLGMLYQQHEWKYYFSISGTSFTATNVEGTRLVKKLSEYSNSANSDILPTAAKW